MDRDEKKRRDASAAPAQNLQLIKPFVVLIVIIGLAIFATTYFVHPEFKSMGLFTENGIDSSAIKVIKSPADTREYRYFSMPNGLQVIAVSDPAADRSAASMDVSVGSFSDPEKFPGLAHFLEHMLFMGSEKYPDENEYSAFLAQHGGGSNAYTASEDTNYHFDLPPEFFEGALDRFAQFFIAPLLRAESTEREVLAVENEHVKNLQSDGWRGMQLFRSLVNPKHPLHKFSTGNLATLCNSSHTGTIATGCEGTRQAMLKLYREHYSAPRMRLAVLHTADPVTLEAMVRRIFAAVPGGPDVGKREPPQWGHPVRLPSQRPRRVEYVPITEQRRLSLSWQLPAMRTFFKFKAGSYVAHLLGHEGEGSLAAALKRRGLIESLSADAATDQRYGAEVELSVSLTQRGLDRVDEVVATALEYVGLLRATGPLEWVWRESADLAAIRFRFQEKADPGGYVVSLASKLQLYPPQYVVSAGYAYESFDADMIRWVLDRLDPAHVDITICSRSFAGKTTAVEPVYGTHYTVQEADPAVVAGWASSGARDKELAIIRPNPFIPTNFTMLPPPPAGPVPPGRVPPRTVVDSPGARLWYKQDWDFPGKNWVAKPKVVLLFQIIAPTASATCRAAVLTSLYTALYTDSLTLTTYDAQVAGMSFGLSGDADGLSLTFSGYNDKMNLLLTQVTDGLVACLRKGTQCGWANPDRFDTIKDELRRGLENSKKASPYSRVMESMGQLMMKRGWSAERLLYEVSLPSVTLDAVSEHVHDLFHKVYIEGLVHGNVPPAFARRSLATLQAALGSRPVADDARELQQVVRLASGLVFAEPHTNPDDLNHAIELYYQAPEQGIVMDVTASLIGEMAAEPCFNQLRTQEQLGYIVSCRSRPMAGSFPPAVNGFSVLIQSSFKDPRELDRSARSFVDGFVRNMSTMPEQMFEAHKQALLARIREKDTTMSDETGRLWGEIVKRRFAWDRQQQLEEALAPLNLEGVAAAARSMIDLTAHSLAVWVYGKDMQPPDDPALLEGGDSERRTRIHSIAAYKR
eukprot:CAMPEP_0172199716 /NCGR_PEP_ID=MMETSP1050-20130122/28854_1 /TAXON_ID=233186 /ORGANISM="Cryptomonas curvata, Strain CCAP979/52" /LENGTH=1032 /DNA_ID=CAMNT_0012876793 /DNA_START=103 /DNA_END=3197 /DNA_ORIENTATION=-